MEGGVDFPQLRQNTEESKLFQTINETKETKEGNKGKLNVPS